MPKSRGQATYARLYSRLHHKYVKHPNADNTLCFYCRKAEAYGLDHCPPLATLEESGTPYTEITENGHKITQWQMRDSRGRTFDPTLVPICRPCAQVLAHATEAFSPEERRHYVQRRKIEETNPSLAASMLGEDKKKSEENPLGLTLRDILLRKKNETN